MLSQSPGTPGGVLARFAQSRSSLSARDLLVPISVGGALVLVDLMSLVFPGGEGAFLILLVPVVLSAALLGRDSALVALTIGAAGALVLVPLRGLPWLQDPADLLLLALYLCVGAGVILIGSVLPDDRESNAQRPRQPTLGPAARPVEALTARELDVLRLAAQGRSLEEIGHQLYLSRNTVKSHLAHAYGKLGAHNRAQAIAAGLSAGLLDAAALDGPD